MPQKQNQLTRRSFLGQSVATGVAAGLGASAIATSRTGQILGANDRIRIGCIGVGNRGTQVLDVFRSFDDVEVAALSDIYAPYLYRDASMVDLHLQAALGGRIPKMGEGFGKSVARYKDFRRLLEQKDIDAVIIATPDHWHAIQTIMACQAEKDIYVEKPLSMTIVEGRKMTETAKEYKRIVQVGLQRRSSPVYLPLAPLIQNGKIGKVSVARAYRISNMYPDGIGKAKPTTPPSELDWDMWLGPRASRPYQENIHPYRFRWWGDYSSQVGNWGVHYFDAIRWLLGEKAPVSVSAHEGGHFVDDDRTIPDTMEVTFEFASGTLLVFGQYEASSGFAIPNGEIELQGTLGTMISNPSYTNAAYYKFVPSPAGQFQEQQKNLDAETVKVETNDPTEAHVRNFLDCVKSRNECRCPLEEGHRSTTFAHLANIALATRSRVEWDPEKEIVTSPSSANKLLHYDYRKPWKLG
ncbi:MAG TPA: Gfo/Idh/MocA family oxidoreductase [Acidobacteriota bacterium]|nr:Gfo/Idh/MocA family oxidoreductase [Acidobacteriota bacterium]